MHAGVLALMTALALAYTWPLPTHLGTRYAVRVPPPAPLSADLLFSSWILASDARRLVHDPLHVFETNNFYPFRHTLAYGENLLGVAVLVLPVQLGWDNPTLTHNVAMLLTLVLGGWGMFLLVRELSGMTLAGLLAGALVIYSPHVWAHVILLPLMAGHWSPVALFLLVRLVREPRWRWSLLLGVVVAWQAWSSLQHGLFLALGLGVTAPVLFVLSASARKALPHVLAAGVIAAILSIPLVLPYRAVAFEMEAHERAGALDFSLIPSRITPPLDHPLGYLADRLRSGERVQSYRALTPWLLVVGGGLAALLRRRRPGADARVLAALAAGGLANLLFAVGPRPHPWLPNFYGLLTTLLPGLAWVRVPMRAIAYTYLILCVLGASGLAAMLRRLQGGIARGLLAAGVFVLIVIEAGWRPIPLAQAPPRRSAVQPALAELDPGCAIAEIPANIETGGLALFRSTTHWRPLINGFSGFAPLPSLATFPLLNQFPSSDSLAFLHAAGGCAVIAHRTSRPEDLSRIVAASRELGLAVHVADTEVLIDLQPPPPPPADPPALARDGWRIAPAAGDLALDGDLETLWRGSVSERTPDRLTVDLGETATVTAVALDLGRHLRLYLRSYRVEGSDDGERWTTLAEAPLAVPPLASYRSDYRRVRQRIALRPTRVRWLRIGPYRRAPQRGLAPDVGWTTWGVAELLVYGEREG